VENARTALTGATGDAEYIAMIEGWAAGFRYTNYRASSTSDGIMIEFERPAEIEQILAPGVLTDEETGVYETGSEPVTYTAQAIPLERLLNAVTEAHSRIETGLQAATKEQLSAIYNEEHQQSVGDRIRGLHWHESYHLGQLEILRQAAGKDDKVV
jgi:hypothetical protein